MKEIAYFILPLGGIFAFLLCLPMQFIQRACISVSCLQLSIGSRLSLRISSTFFFYSLCRFIHTWIRVNQDYSHAGVGISLDSPDKWTGFPLSSAGRYPGAHTSPGSVGSLDVRRQAQVLRHQRNFWITLSAVFIWLFVWWLAKLLRWYWQAIEQKEAVVKELKKKRESAPLCPPEKGATRSKPRKVDEGEDADTRSQEEKAGNEGIEMTCTSQRKNTYEKSRQRVAGAKEGVSGSAVID
ncbi:b-cell receptor-associated 31-like protein [Cystoisospora suis]|uniref:B-cell receptor-associated 31-like protein n=1 Tax=Cystoisospora suis TaxID=483139 RepID=A0A2C6L6X4_9APIC|nr:b-cell receptor-associated 31-like protein [Cystoisospora suis]